MVPFNGNYKKKKIMFDDKAKCEWNLWGWCRAPPLLDQSPSV